MKRTAFCVLASLIVFISPAPFALADDAIQSTPAATPADLEAMYTTAIESRTDAILTALNLTNSVQTKRVHDLIIAQYRVLKARDMLIDAQLKAEDKEINYSNRAPQIQFETKSLHARFIANLSAILTPEQVEIVKNKMTYNTVKVTFDAYCQIIPNLTETDKSKILELLKAAREEAIDGGSAPEKAAIFKQYKKQINAYLDAHGHDVAKAFKDWGAKQKPTKTAAKGDDSKAGSAAQ